MPATHSAETTSPLVSTANRDKRERRKRRRRLLARGGAAAVLVAAVIVGRQLARANPAAPARAAEREFSVNSLKPTEQVIAQATVFQRPAVEYFRATRGKLVLTSRRLVFLGLTPRDPLTAAEGPATFREEEFPIDTLVEVRKGRAFFFLAPAIVVDGPLGRETFGVPAGADADAKALLDSVRVRHEALLAAGVRQRERRESAARAREMVEADARKPRYYTVRPGDAIATIAARWNTTPEKLREWNKLPDNRIRVGDSLLVRPGS